MRRGLELRDLPDGCALLDVNQEVVHLLNPSAAFILQLCDGTRTAEEIARQLVVALPALALDDARHDVARAIEELVAAGIVEES